MKFVTAKVTYPAYVSMEVPDDLTPPEIKERILDQADQILESSGIKPIIDECNIPELQE